MTERRSLRDLRTEIIGAVVTLALFVFAVWAAGRYESELTALVGQGGALGMAVYTGLTAVAVFAAPIATLPLLPIAVALWGATTGALLSIIGWTSGGIIAFVLARRFGAPLVARLVSLETIERYRALLPERELFWSVVLLRMVIPVDVLSYAIGLFLPMRLSRYSVATLIGVTPFAFVFAYTVTLSLPFKIGVGVSVVVLLAVVYVRMYRRVRREKQEE